MRTLEKMSWKSSYGYAMSTPYACFWTRKGKKNPCKRASPVRAHVEEIRVWQGKDGKRSRKCPRTLPKRRYFYTTSRGVGKWQLGTICFAYVFDTFLPIFRFLGQKSPPGSKTLNPVRTPGCVFRCFSWKIVSQNHQYSLGFNRYFERGDDGKMDSKRIEKRQCSCVFLDDFRGKQKMASEKDQ